MNKKHHNLFMVFIEISFLIFIVIYILSVSGYYETKLHEKTVYTSEQIEQFEQDVKEGKEVDINSYVNNETKNYNNNYTEAGDRLGRFVNGIMTNGFNNVWNTFKFLFY
jgi:hypothetical protein